MDKIEEEKEQELYVEQVQVVQAESVPEAKKITFIDNCKMHVMYYKDWCLINIDTIIFFSSVFMFFTGIYCVNTLYYIKGQVWPEEYTFLSSSGKEISFTIWIVIWAIFTGYAQCLPLADSFYMYHELKISCIMFIWTLFLVTLPFALVHHYKHVEYHSLCDGYVYTIEIHDKVVKFEGNDIFKIKTTRGVTDNSITIETGPLPIKGYSFMSTKFGGHDGVMIPYNSDTIDLFNSTLMSNKNNKWNGEKAIINEMIFMKYPSDKTIFKICANEFADNILKLTTVVPVLRTRYNTCRSCMKSCMTRCKRWDNKYVMYTYKSCTGSGSQKQCSQRIGWRNETYCAEYYTYNDCIGPCFAPACTGITL